MEDFNIVETEQDNVESGTSGATGATNGPEVIEEAQEPNETENPSSELSSDDLYISTEQTEEPVYYEDYMELQFFTGESFPLILSSSVISGFGLTTIFFLIGFAIFKAVSLININKEKGD